MPDNPFRPIVAPCVGEGRKFNVKYDSKNFLEFPSKHGRNLQNLQKAEFEGSDAACTAAFLQEWLYFGLINSIFQVCGIDFNRNDWIRHTSSFVSPTH